MNAEKSKLKVLLLWLLFVSPFLFSACGSHFKAGYVKGPESNIDTLPMRWIADLLAVDIMVNDTPATFILDNGFSLSGIDQELAIKLNLKSRSSSKATDGNNQSTSLDKVKVKSIRLGAFDFKQTQAYILDTRKFLPCDTIDGILGSSVFNKMNWHFNMDRMELYVYNAPLEFPGDSIPVKFRFNNSHLINVGVDSLIVPTQVDLGYTGQWKFKKSKLLPHFEAYAHYRSIGIHSLSVTGLGKSDTIYNAWDNGNLKFGKRRVSVPGEVELTEHFKYNGRVGIGYMKNFNFTLLSDQKVYLMEARKLEPDWDLYSYGVNIYKIQGTYKVISYLPEMGDYASIYQKEVQSINDFALNEEVSICELKSQFKQWKDQKQDLEIRFKDGSDLKVSWRKIPVNHKSEL